MVVYAEYVFLENFIMNYIILSLTSKFSKQGVKKVKLIIAASFGALYAFIIFFPSLHFLLSVFMKIACSMLIVIVGFTPYSFKDFFRILGVFYLITLIFGGAGFALFYFTSFNGIISNGIFYITDISIKKLLVSCGVGYVLIQFCWGYIYKQVFKEKIYMNVKIQIEDRTVAIKGMVDTGNSLVDPITHYPVIIVEYDAITDLLPQEIKGIVNQSKTINFNEFTLLLEDSVWMKRIRIIPFKALGTENGLLVGFKPDHVSIEKENHDKNIEEIIIAIYNKKLSRTGEYNALLHPDLV